MRETIKFSLSDEQYTALAQIARRDVRPIAMQAEHIVLEALKREKVLPTTHPATAESEVPDAARAR